MKIVVYTEENSKNLVGSLLQVSIPKKYKDSTAIVSKYLAKSKEVKNSRVMDSKKPLH